LLPLAVQAGLAKPGQSGTKLSPANRAGKVGRMRPDAIPPEGRLVRWCPGAESNHRHCDFQSHALPTELPGRPGPFRAATEVLIGKAPAACPAPSAPSLGEPCRPRALGRERSPTGARLHGSARPERSVAGEGPRGQPISPRVAPSLAEATRDTIRRTQEATEDPLRRASVVDSTEQEGLAA